ncbi:type II CAAX endopeptidase family protein [Tepidibacter formicigenes]|jgi:membrane protease YdiL (CAAX protease family)|uniref:CAAX prenyl protease 2/Lysostaphin resistance protein A-like domain-containing protein n=1 Tax=Tepidibacter formicigenes DSM 15518 TaxID=1123349 RepID=A0A1M6MLB7_9FIRM|nr:type II CAAX endopeptidase family protein [Tepidibacter formicigenes]SHJ84242.1 hypothetical protein SAMN02744037_00983 [Tepidibacter formicigenes DSM 15518]
MKKSTASNSIYLLLAVLFLTVGVYFQKKDIDTGLIITEYMIIFLPALIFSFAFKKEKLKEFLRFNKTSFKNIILAIFITLFTYPIAVFGNLIIISILNFFGHNNVPQVPFANSDIQYVWFLFLMGITPGICEETLFRGFFLRMNQDKGMKKSILYTAFLFALFHFNIYNFMGPFILGIVFGYMTIITNSIYPSIVGHAINNSIATTLGYFVLNKNGSNISSEIPLNIILFQIIFYGVLAIVSFFMVKYLFKMIKRNNNLTIESIEKDNIFSYIPIVICIFIYMYIFVKI